ncbi:hypothetical protein J14TS5_50740 [Paenibacillus lautus]|nr:hypothetical protein J14TS5_50740 [Paenibacillus lautus]
MKTNVRGQGTKRKTAHRQNDYRQGDCQAGSRRLCAEGNQSRRQSLSSALFDGVGRDVVPKVQETLARVNNKTRKGISDEEYDTLVSLLKLHFEI